MQVDAAERAFALVPAGQLSQEMWEEGVILSSAVCVPEGHGEQSSTESWRSGEEAGSDRYFPDGQAVQAGEMESEYAPAEQGVFVQVWE